MESAVLSFINVRICNILCQLLYIVMHRWDCKEQDVAAQVVCPYAQLHTWRTLVSSIFGNLKVVVVVQTCKQQLKQ